jgi:nucleoid DNA-binding protein
VKKITALAFVCIASFLNAQDADIQKINQALNILKKANESSISSAPEQSKTPGEIIQEIKQSKEVESLRAAEGEYKEEDLNKRIDKIVNYFTNNAKNFESITIKTFGKYKECDEKTKKCQTIALVKKSELEAALNQLRQNTKKSLLSNITAAKALYTVKPLSLRKLKVETFENEVYSIKDSSTTAITSYTTVAQNDIDVAVVDKEVVNGRYKISVKDDAVIIGEI